MRQFHKLLDPSRPLVFLLGGLLLASSALAEAPSTPRERLRAIAPLIESKAMGEKVNGQHRRQAESLGMQEARLALWLNLFVSHGEPGLVSLSQASAIEMAKDVAGTWKMRHRLMDAQPSRQEAWMFHEIVEMRPGFSRIRSLTLEAGVLERALRSPTNESGRFRLGAYGEVTHQEVSGPKWGLEQGESGVLQRFDGELFGVGYPGIDLNSVRSRTEALWVNQGGVYRTVFFNHEFEDMSPSSQFQGLSDPDDPSPRRLFGATEETTLDDGSHDTAAALTTISGASQVLTYANFDSGEAYLKVSDDVLISNLARFWLRAKEDTRLLDPSVAMRESRDRRGLWDWDGPKLQPRRR